MRRNKMVKYHLSISIALNLYFARECIYVYIFDCTNKNIEINREIYAFMRVYVCMIDRYV